eukprot:jgi/Hompol1/3615/HPOL_003302-RA
MTKAIGIDLGTTY